MIGSFTHLANVIVITFVAGSNVPVTQVVSQHVQNESFCESVISETKNAVTELSPDSTFISWCPKVSNPVIQSQPRVGSTNQGDRNQFPK